MAFNLYGARTATILTLLISPLSASELKIITHSASGGHFVQAQTLARYLPKYIPSLERVTIYPVTGGGGVPSLNYLAQAAKRDGSEIAIINHNAIPAVMAGGDHIKVKLSHLNWIGSHVDGRKSPVLLWKRKDSKDLIIGSEGGTFNSPVTIIGDILGVKFKEVPGYPNVPQIKLAMQRKEVTGMFQNMSGTQTMSPDWFTDPSYEILFQYGNGRNRHPLLKNTITLSEMVSDEVSQQKLKRFELQSTVVRGVAAPPDVPAKKLKELRIAFEQIMIDPNFLAEAQKMNMEISPIRWDKVQDIMQRLEQ